MAVPSTRSTRSHLLLLLVFMFLLVYPLVAKRLEPRFVTYILFTLPSCVDVRSSISRAISSNSLKHTSVHIQNALGYLQTHVHTSMLNY